MDFLRNRLRNLIYQFPLLVDRLSDEDLKTAWAALRSVYYDLYMLEAIHQANRNVQPGDTMNYEEAIRVLRLP